MPIPEASGGYQWRAVRMLILVIGAVTVFALAHPARAQTGPDPDPLADVDVHTDYIGPGQEEAMRRGLELLWDFLKPHLSRLGYDRLPQMNMWGYTTRDQAIANSGNAGLWRAGFGGFAHPGTAHVLVLHESDIAGAPHEAMHLVQFAVAGNNPGQDCLNEGAATWYGTRVDAKARPTFPFATRLEMSKPYNDIDSFYLDLLQHASEELGSEIEIPPTWEEGLPHITALETHNQFYNAALENRRVYNLCFLAFDLLMNTGGGEAAYFHYLTDIPRMGWRAAFDANFAEDYATFVRRSDVWRATKMADPRLPHEIRADRIVERLLAICHPTSRIRACPA